MLDQTQSEKIWALIKTCKVAMLTSLDNGIIRARPMHQVQDEFSGTLWFFTDIRAAKTEEITQDQHVGITYIDPERDVYVSLSGMAQLSRNRRMIDQLWNSSTAAWFPKGKEDENLVLLNIRIDQAEYWDDRKNQMVKLYEALKSTLTDKKPSLGDNKKYE